METKPEKSYDPQEPKEEDLYPNENVSSGIREIDHQQLKKHALEIEFEDPKSEKLSEEEIDGMLRSARLDDKGQLFFGLLKRNKKFRIYWAEGGQVTFVWVNGQSISLSASEKFLAKWGPVLTDLKNIVTDVSKTREIIRRQIDLDSHQTGANDYLLKGLL